jgi:hypothetical protein
LAAAGANLLADGGRERRKEAEGEGGCRLRVGKNGRGVGIRVCDYIYIGFMGSPG